MDRECPEQKMADEALRNLFSHSAPPELSPSFNRKLSQRIAAESAQPSRRPRLIMQAYWLAVCIFSTYILLGTQSMTPGGRIALIMLLVCIALPTLLLGKRLHFSLFDLILSTMNHPQIQAESVRNKHAAG